jgi:hypothetical protein
MFRALLADPKEVLHKQHLVYRVLVMSVVCHSMPGAANLHNTHTMYQVSFVQRFLRMSK